MLLDRRQKRQSIPWSTGQKMTEAWAASWTADSAPSDTTNLNRGNRNRGNGKKRGGAWPGRMHFFNFQFARCHITGFWILCAVLRCALVFQNKNAEL